MYICIYILNIYAYIYLYKYIGNKSHSGIILLRGDRHKRIIVIIMPYATKTYCIYISIYVKIYIRIYVMSYIYPLI
jgi:hypothetical protein